MIIRVIRFFKTYDKFIFGEIRKSIYTMFLFLDDDGQFPISDNTYVYLLVIFFVVIAVIIPIGEGLWILRNRWRYRSGMSWFLGEKGPFINAPSVLWGLARPKPDFSKYDKEDNSKSWKRGFNSHW